MSQRVVTADSVNDVKFQNVVHLDKFSTNTNTNKCFTNCRSRQICSYLQKNLKDNN